MSEGESKRPRVGISGCLLGERVRWDGGDKRDPALLDALGPFVEWVPVCPEVELGLGVPREPIHLVGTRGASRLVVERTGEDLTTRMRAFAEVRIGELARLGLDGYVLKARSPSCGLAGVPVHAASTIDLGSGLFASVLLAELPDLAVEEDERLADPAVRGQFLARVVAACRRRAQS